MQLQFHKSTHSYMIMPLQEIQNGEATQEIKLPDGMPDIGRILAAWGQVILRGKEWRGDSVACSGGLMVWVLYAPEDGSQERVIDGWIPFQMKWDLPDRTPEGEIRIRCMPRFVDARSVSPRKIMVRSGVAAMAEAFSPMEGETYLPDENIQGVELLRSTYPIRLPKEVGEKTFLIDEELTVSGPDPQPEKIIYYCLRPAVTDKKVLANKIVFRGNGNLHVLYRGEEGQMNSVDFEVSLSQYAQLNGEYSVDAQVDVFLMPTSLELELDDEGHFRLKAGLTAQYIVNDREMLELIQDAYAPNRELRGELRQMELPAILESRRENLYGEQNIPADADQGVDVSFLPDFPRQRRNGDRVEMEIPGTFQVLYYGADGVLHTAIARWEGQYAMNADENSRLTVLPMAVEGLQAGVGNGSVNVKMELPLAVTAMTRQEIPMVIGIELGEQTEPEANRPSLILCRAGSMGLWDMAKTAGSTVDAIRKANQLTEEPVPGQMLLIPVN